MKLIVMSTGSFTLSLIKKLSLVPQIDLIGVIPDNSVDEAEVGKFRMKVEQLGIPVGNDSLMNEADIILVVEYRKLIKESVVNKYNIINVHAGILPKYKGFSSNAFAILNGEKQIGYTIHKMDKSMDGGDIYYVKKIDILEDETYSDVHDRLLQDMLEMIPAILVKISNGQISSHPQEGKSIYGCKFKPDYGRLDFKKTTDWIYNLYRCMAKPLGTGVYFEYKNQSYEVGLVKKSKDVDDYYGMEGIIVNIVDNDLWVKTQDNIIVLSGITPEMKWKIGMQL